MQHLDKLSDEQLVQYIIDHGYLTVHELKSKSRAQLIKIIEFYESDTE